MNADSHFRARLLLSPEGTARGYLKKFVRMLKKINDEFSTVNWSNDYALTYFVTATKTKGLTPNEQRETLKITGTADQVKLAFKKRVDALNDLRKSEVARIERIWDAVAAAHFATLKEAPPSPDSTTYPYREIAKAALGFVADDER